MTSETRFDCPSSRLGLRELLRKTRSVLWISFAVGLTFHLCLTQVRGSKGHGPTAKPLTTHFVKRQPRLTKPLELKKRPRPKHQQIRRRMVSVKARMQRGGAPALFEGRQVISALVRPTVAIGRIAASRGHQMEPQAIAEAIESSREMEQKIDMSLELLDILSLDTGKYHALVIEDPNDKRGIKGFCHLAVAKLRDAFPGTGDYSFERHCLPGFLRLSIIMNRDTDIKTDILGRLALDDAELFKVPWLFLNARRSFRLTDAELRNLGKYMMSGGFIFTDGVGVLRTTIWSEGLIALFNSLAGALKTQGVDAALENLPNSHPVFHCYFDFDGPPVGGDAAFVHGMPDLYRVVPYLEGMQVNGRLLATFSRKDYSHAWTYWGPDNFLNYSDWTTWDPTHPLRFGVNTIIFALTQEGSITRRLLDTIQ